MLYWIYDTRETVSETVFEFEKVWAGTYNTWADVNIPWGFFYAGY